MNPKYSILSLLILFMACNENKKPENKTENTPTSEVKQIKMKPDIHTFAKVDEANSTHIHLDLNVNFDTKTISGIATHDIKNNTKSDKIIFDTKDLDIQKVTLDDDASTVEFSWGEESELLGKALIVPIKENTKKVHIHYSTSPEVEAIQWLNPTQTKGKKHPFLFTQGQAILTRSWIPCQDSPGNRITYSAKVKVPKDLIAVMSATNTYAKNESGTYDFNMPQAIPCYLIALAVGDLEYHKISNRAGVFAEPKMLEACAHEFADMEKMIVAAEKLYGKYAWDKYDVIVLPPSFPFGGMENPRLTFATPTIIAGDRSLTSLIAHELAHSWSGNLVTNANWNDFWLNEGFTVYFENRIIEALYGKDYADMLRVLGYNGLIEELAELDANDTKLQLDLPKDRSPDEGVTSIAYEKGALFLTALEQHIGRERMDKFLNEYFAHFAFKNITTEKFETYVKEKLPEAKDFNMDVWIHETGLPENHPVIVSERFNKVDAAISSFENDKSVSFETKDWSTHEWLRFINGVDERITSDNLKILDEAFDFTNSNNSEIACAWFKKSIQGGYDDVLPKTEEFLIKVGRRKFLTPLYKALLEADKKDLALKIYEKARPNYHFVSFNTMDELLGWK